MSSRPEDDDRSSHPVPLIDPARLLRRLLSTEGGASEDGSSAPRRSLAFAFIRWLGSRGRSRTVSREEVEVAGQVLERLRGDEPADPATLVAYGYLLEAAGLLGDALAHYRAALRAPRQSDSSRGRAHEALGSALRLALRNEEGRRESEHALGAYEAADNPRGVSRVLGILAAVAQAAGDLARAEALYRDALEAGRRVAEPGYMAHAEGGLGAIALERRSYLAAKGHYETALRFSRGTGAVRLAALHEGYLALAHVGLEQWQEAHRHLDACIEGCLAAGYTAGYAVFRAVRAATLAAREDLAQAEVELTEGFAVARGSDGIRALVDLWAAHIDLARQRASERAGDRQGARAAARRVAQRVAAAGAEEAGRPSLLSRSDDARFAVALLSSVRTSVEREDASDRASPEGGSLEVGLGGSWFRLEGEPLVDLRRKRVAARLLAALIGGAEEGVTSAWLAEQVWPGELPSDKTTKRLYVAINQLRQLGLADVLVRDEDRYRLAGSIVFRPGAPESSS